MVSKYRSTCNYCLNSIPKEDIGTTSGWIRIVFKKPDIVLVGCPDHSEKAMILAVELIRRKKKQQLEMLRT